MILEFGMNCHCVFVMYQVVSQLKLSSVFTFMRYCNEHFVKIVILAAAGVYELYDVCRLHRSATDLQSTPGAARRETPSNAPDNGSNGNNAAEHLNTAGTLRLMSHTRSDTKLCASTQPTTSLDTVKPPI